MERCVRVRGGHSNRHRIKQSKQNTQGFNWHWYRGRGTREGVIVHVIEHKWNFWTRLQRSFSLGRQGSEWEREGKSEREKERDRGYGNIPSIQRSPKKGILDPVDALSAPPEKRCLLILQPYNLAEIQKKGNVLPTNNQEKETTWHILFLVALSIRGFVRRTPLFRQKAKPRAGHPLMTLFLLGCSLTADPQMK